MAGTYYQIQDFMIQMRRPVRAELVTMLDEPQRRIVRSLRERASQLQVFEDEYEELVEFARSRAIPNYGRF